MQVGIVVGMKFCGTFLVELKEFQVFLNLFQNALVKAVVCFQPPDGRTTLRLFFMIADPGAECSVNAVFIKEIPVRIFKCKIDGDGMKILVVVFPQGFYIAVESSAKNFIPFSKRPALIVQHQKGFAGLLCHVSGKFGCHGISIVHPRCQQVARFAQCSFNHCWKFRQWDAEIPFLPVPVDGFPFIMFL